ncbi:MAG: hypothetical protein P1V20_05925 [Verrucomicrobiales bacterium]|nr:hypothetical protein [Verrucomicrobiales bacterium]
MSEDSLTRTVYHECGHAITAILLGGEIDLLTIEPEEEDELPGRTGEIRVVWPEGRWSEAELAVREIKVALAGPMVEMIYDGTQFAPEFLEEWHYDWQLAVDRANEFLPRNKSVAQHLARFAHELLTFFERDDVWAAVAALADELEAHQSLEPEDVDEVLAAWPIDRDWK